MTITSPLSVSVTDEKVGEINRRIDEISSMSNASRRPRSRSLEGHLRELADEYPAAKVAEIWPVLRALVQVWCKATAHLRK